MDPLAIFGRNDRCWCGEPLKYKYCHGRHRPPSTPGQPIGQPDDEFHYWLSPTVAVARDALHQPGASVPIVLPIGRPQARAIDVSPAVQALLDAPRLSPQPLSVLGKHRFEIFDHTEHDRDALSHGVSGLAVAVGQALTVLTARQDQRPTILWND